MRALLSYFRELGVDEVFMPEHDTPQGFRGLPTSVLKKKLQAQLPLEGQRTKAGATSQETHSTSRKTLEVKASPTPESLHEQTSQPQETALRQPPEALSPVSSSCPFANARTLDELHAAVNAFEGCELKEFATTTVFSDGNPQSDLMLIGEAPGAEEDRQGKPFVGRSGQLLDKILAAIGLDRTSVYIANIIPWRPPHNRVPTPAETALCLPMIARHISLIKPKLLVLLGSTAAKTILARKEGITRLRGTTHQYQNAFLAQPIPAIATFHPAYLLRSPGQKREAWHDFLTIKQIREATL